jgi:3'-5' exoribonuclease
MAQRQAATDRLMQVGAARTDHSDALLSGDGDPTPRYLTATEICSAVPGTSLEGRALVLHSDTATDHSARAYLRLTLRGADGGIIDARWWRYPYPPERRPRAGQVCWFSGDVEVFGGNRQLRIRQGRPSPDADINAFVLATRTPVEVLQRQLDTYINELDVALQALVRAVLTGEVYTRFCEWPAAHYRHGAVRHGLLAHSLRVVELARQLTSAYSSGGLAHDAGVVTAASLLHDVGKTRTLPAVAGATLPEDASRFDHVTLGVLMVRFAAAHATPPLEGERLDTLLHAMLAHHGRKEWGAPVEPQTVEAWLVHLADLAESRLWVWSGEEPRDEASG